ncbi:MAG: hypothetical protein G01um101466_609 [Parcubacteria group bacterium Gr01-1014_66]|nr:MAG: hypothetical protein G01um101466_609 [Parcubacteria group bacterium Gr01-1014_66]
MVKSVILWAFLRPGSKTLFVGGNYYPIEKLRRNVERKRRAIKIAFGRDISREAIQECFILLQKGGVILTRRMDNSKLFCSLNQDEKGTHAPWEEIINVINRRMKEIRWLPDNFSP